LRALDYFRKGFCPIPIPKGEKGPKVKGWKELRYTEADLPMVFGEGAVNIGLLLGEPSGWLTDVDLDCAEAVVLAAVFLPGMGWKSGRKSKPKSHWWFLCAGAKTRKFEDGKGVVLEIRSTGSQTVVPPSVHPSREEYEWDQFDEPASVNLDALVWAASCLA